MATVTLANSTYLDFTSYRATSATTPEAAYGLTPGEIEHSGSAVNVALVLPRANDPTALLTADWGTRQHMLAELTASGSLWSTYGANKAQYDLVMHDLATMGIPVIGDAHASDGYVTSVESRTIWVSLDVAQFKALFGTDLLRVGPADDADLLFWNGSLSLPDTWAVSGIWLDVNGYPATSNLAGSASVTLPQGPQGVGNSSTLASNFFPQQIGQDFYNFPAEWATQATGTIGLLEPAIGDALPSDATQTFEQLLNAYRRTADIATDGHYYVQAGGGVVYDNSDGERSLDVGVVSSAAPGSTIGLYAGSGFDGNAYASSYTAYQAAFWDQVHNPGVISSSFGDYEMPAPGSPFYYATSQLFIDAALRNISVFSAVGDGGSGDQWPDGITNQYTTYSSPYGVLVGGTSLTTPAAALDDPTLAAILAEVQAGNLGTIWQLVSGGLTGLPDLTKGMASTDSTFVETLWNLYKLEGDMLNPGYYVNNAGSGGTDPTQPTPWYQLAYGLTPTTADPIRQQGRGTPDVSAVAGGNMLYKVPGADMSGIWYDYGTSAATPFWASLAAHINAVFADIGLPPMGYANDLLYTAAVVAPAAFNDVTIGTNMSTFVEGGSIRTHTGNGDIVHITATGFGDAAGPGYDLVTGLGSPNALLLARSLSAIATAQYYFDTPDVLVSDGSGWTSPATQSLLFQSTLSADAQVHVQWGQTSLTYAGQAGDMYAWTAQFAQQTLQADFSPALVTLYDERSQGTLLQSTVGGGSTLGIHIGGAATGTPQAELSSAFGYVDFVSDVADSAVQVARAVAVAETAGAANDMDAVVRLRQNGVLDVAVMFYKVDDFAGTIDGVAPGQAGYDAAAFGRAYQTTAGGIWADGAGYGQYSQTDITHVNAGDLIAMTLTAGGNTYHAFAQANETVDGRSVGHLWSYGLNTWGWEDVYGGGDHDYNDLVVQLDFTSTAAAGHGLI
ncbi:DUF4114 domain-containing protein [Azorhizobium doebereinerae]|uniref:DUF4114 domain-containing protein n=1 Tax=Azorhizobium doebereinerae TaxID=281091 RepID=UPI0003FC6B23|nr:hypothetical protein [Azorhizobium doebereinerae]